MLRPRRSTPLLALLLGFAIALLPGCSVRDNPIGIDSGLEDGVAALSPRIAENGVEGGTDHGPRGFYPLALGNRWSFEVTTQIRIGPAGGPLGDPIAVTESQVRELMCQETAGDRTYVVEETRVVSGENNTTWWVRYRQDAGGLYEHDVSPTNPPACGPALSAPSGMVRAGGDAAAAGGVLSERIAAAVPDPARRRATLAAWQSMRDRLRMVSSSLAVGVGAEDRLDGVAEGEITRLGYPLHGGGRWVIRDDPRFSAVVEGLDVVRTPRGPVPAWRIRIHSELFGPSDRVYQWVARIGFVRLTAHLESVGTDENGNPSRMVIEAVERLTDFRVTRREHTLERSPMEPVAAD